MKTVPFFHEMWELASKTFVTQIFVSEVFK